MADHRVPAFQIVKAIDVIDHVGLGLIACAIGFAEQASRQTIGRPSTRPAYTRIERAAHKAFLERDLAELVVASKRKTNINKYSTPAQRAGIFAQRCSATSTRSWRFASLQTMPTAGPRISSSASPKLAGQPPFQTWLRRSHMDYRTIFCIRRSIHRAIGDSRLSSRVGATSAGRGCS
jgi:hypothetical protein